MTVKGLIEFLSTLPLDYEVQGFPEEHYRTAPFDDAAVLDNEGLVILHFNYDLDDDDF